MAENLKKDVPISERPIYKLLRLLNMSISEKLVKLWFTHVKSNLECATQERRDFEETHKQARVDIPFLLHHEFLFLLCNCLPRIDNINKVHKQDFHSNFGEIY